MLPLTNRQTMKPTKKILLIILALVLLSNVLIGQIVINSTNQGIGIPEGGTFTYCTTDPIDIIYNEIPGNKTFSGTGIIDLGTLSPATATFDPGSIGAGTYIVSYFSKNWTFIVVDPPIVSFTAIPNVCENDMAINLAPYGLPAGGTFGGTGVDAGGYFYPASTGPGTFILSYTYPTTSCSDTKYQTITVEPVPSVSLSIPIAIKYACINGASFALSGGSPGGGIYSGSGVIGGTNFDPAVAGVGTHTIAYTYTTGTGCSAFATDVIIVRPTPIIKTTSKTDFCTGSGLGSITVYSIDAGIDYQLMNQTTGTLVSTQS